MEYQNSLFAKIASDLRIQAASVLLPFLKNRDFPDLGLRAALFGEEGSFSEELPVPDQGKGKRKFWMLRDVFRCHYFLAPNREYTRMWMLGPYLMEDLNLGEISSIGRKIGMKNIDLQYMRQYYHMLPRIRDANLMYAIVSNHCAEIYGADNYEILYWEIPFSAKTPQDRAGTKNTEYLRDTVEYNYAQEQLMMRCISEGNHHGAVSVIMRMEAKSVETRTGNTIRDMKNYSIIFNTLCRVAARGGGLSPWEVDQISREFSLQIENAATIHELKLVRENMLREYCSRVREGHGQKYSQPVQRMIDQIGSEFSRDLTLAGLAEGMNHSPNYLSARFRKETGKTFSEYLADVRIVYAEELLRETDLPVTVIAGDCGIPDSNYFSRVFRQKTGMTPTEYRESCRPA